MTASVQRAPKTKLLEAALQVFRAKGYAAATVDDICEAAGVTKGSFFHHFKSKEELTVGATAYWREWTDGLFAAAPYRKISDPRDRLLAYVDFRVAILNGDVPDFTCLLGTLVQETYLTHPPIREACDRGLEHHIADVTRDVEAAKKLYAPNADWSAESVAYYIQAVLQGSFIFAKAKQNSDIARENLRHLRRYLESLFDHPRKN